MRFLLHMSEVTTPENFTVDERTIEFDSGTVRVMQYSSKSVQSDRYFVLVHGLTPREYDHPVMNLLAASICDATGMNVLKPCMVVSS